MAPAVLAWAIYTHRFWPDEWQEELMVSKIMDILGDEGLLRSYERHMADCEGQ